MLTKNLLQFKKRKDKIYPTLIAITDESALHCAKDLIAIYEESPGKSFIEIEKKSLSSTYAKNIIFKGFKKLLEDRCKESPKDNQEDLEKLRWQWILNAQELRQRVLYKNLEEFQENFGFEQQTTFSKISTAIYSDLPEHNLIEEFQSITPLNLIHRYNCAQIQGLLLYAKELTIEINQPKITKLRSLFQQLRFHRLLCEMKEHHENKCIFTISGPLTITSQRQSYGIRIANFFPHILNQDEWKVHTVLVIKKDKKDKLNLEISNKMDLFSHYQAKESYTPKELTGFIEDFNNKSTNWQAKTGFEFVHLGQQSYCFPDVTFISSERKKIHLELFHHWHHSQLAQRLSTLGKKVNSPLIIGVCRSILKKNPSNICLQNSEWFSKNGFLFRDFPTPTKVFKLLSDNLNRG